MQHHGSLAAPKKHKYEDVIKHGELESLIRSIGSVVEPARGLDKVHGCKLMHCVGAKFGLPLHPPSLVSSGSVTVQSRKRYLVPSKKY